MLVGGRAGVRDLMGALGSILLWLVSKIFGGGGKEDSATRNARELGRAEQQNADMKADTVVIRRANEAAKKAEQQGGSDDPNDRDARR